MQSLGALLDKKKKNPLFQKAVAFGKLKEAIDFFFKGRDLPVSFNDYDEKRGLLILSAPHPSLAQEALFLKDALGAFLKKHALISVSQTKIIVEQVTKSP